MGTSDAAALEEEGPKLEEQEIAALCKAAEVLRAEPSKVLQEEMSCMMELLVSWGGSLEQLPAPVPVTNGSPAKKPAATVETLLEDSDEEMEVSGAVAEMLLPPNLLSDEFADEAQDLTGEESVPKDKPPFPPFPPRNFQAPSDARKRALNKVKQQASEMLADGQADKALEKYSELIRTGGATALIMAARAEILLQLERPCAAIRDCCAALQMNADCGKAHHIRGAAHRKLGHWKKAYRDLSQGQNLDFQDQYAAMHAFVAQKAGVSQQKKAASGSKRKAVEQVTVEDPPKPKGPSKDFKIAQAVRLAGLQKAPHLNGRRGLIVRLGPSDNDRWDVEIRMDRGCVEVKAIRSENIIAVPRNQAAEWQLEETKFAQERKVREKEDKRWKEEQERSARFTGKLDKGLKAAGFPTMDASERLEAEMSALPLDHEALALLRRLRPSEALAVLQQVSIQGINNNISSYIKIKIRAKLGEPDSDDEKKMPKPVPARAQPPPAQPAAPAAPAPAPAAPTPAPAAPVAASAPMEDDSEEDSEDEDFDIMPEEKEPTLSSGSHEPEPSEKQQEALARWKGEAQSALDAGDAKKALELFSEIIDGGGASALMLTKRGDLLLKERRPLAAIKDCTAAISANSDLGKAYRIRGMAYRKLGRYREAKTDLVQAQKLDFDEGISAVEKFVAQKVRLEEKKMRKRQRTH